MITIFSTPKNFEGIFDTIQINALSSWRALSTEIEIIIFGDSKGSKEAAAKFNAKYVPEVRCSPRGQPYLSDLFYKAGKIAKHPILTFINGYIILPDNFLTVIQNIAKGFNKFLIVGHRWDMDVNDSINFANTTERKRFWCNAKKKSEKHACTGIDYFVFRKKLFNKFPNFAIGRPGHDNWILWNARRHFIPLIDISNEVMAVHQNHYHLLEQFHDLDSISNKKLCGENTLNLLDTNYHLVNGKIVKKRSREFINRNLGKLPKIFPEFSFLLILYKKIYRRLINNYLI